MSASRFGRLFAFKFTSLFVSRFTSSFLMAVLISPMACLAQSEFAEKASGSSKKATASAWGRVLLAGEDRPIRHARVEFLISSTGWASSTLTDADGKFDFADLSRVTYQVSVSAPGYEKLEQTTQVEESTGPLLLRLRKIETPATPMNDSVVSVQELRNSGKGQKEFDRGTQLLLKGDAAGSIVYFQRAIARDPTYYRAYYDLGLARFRLGQTAEAEQAFQKSIDLTGGGYAPADFLMGVILCQKQEFRQAETVMQRGLEVDPGSALGKIFLGWAQFALNRPVEAERSAHQALFRKADLPEAYFLLAHIHQRQHNPPAVVADLEAYFKLDPQGPESDEARSLLVTAQREMGQSQDEAAAITERP